LPAGAWSPVVDEGECVLDGPSGGVRLRSRRCVIGGLVSMILVVACGTSVPPPAQRTPGSSQTSSPTSPAAPPTGSAAGLSPTPTTTGGATPAATAGATPGAPGSLGADAAAVALDRLAANSSVPLEYGFVNGFPRQVVVSVPAVGNDPVGRAMRFLADNRDLYGLGPEVGLGVRKVSAPAGAPFAVVALYEAYRGVPVHAAELSVSIFGDRILGTTGRLLPDPHVETIPTVSSVEAEAVARTFAGEATAPTLGVTTLLIHDPSLVSEAAPRARLAWRVHLAGAPTRAIFIDALDGRVLDEEPVSDSEYGLELNDAENEANADDSGCFWNSDETVIGDEDGIDPDYLDDQDAVGAWNYARDTHAWFLNRFGRDSYDGDGEELELFLHTTIDSGGTWSAGTGCDLFQFEDGWGLSDVVTHEFTHAVNTYGAGLLGRNASGALNESMADTFAWLRTGTVLVATGAPGGPVRNFQFPDAAGFGDPDTWSERDKGSADKGEVHKNAGIPNRAAYLLAMGGTHPDTNVTVKGIGKARMGHLYYWALAMFLPMGGDVLDLRDTLIMLANGFDYLSSEKCAIVNAFGAVEVGQPDNDCDGILDFTNDQDGDFVRDKFDNCPTVKNPANKNLDGDKLGDACDPDIDGDGIPEVPVPPQLTGDNCPGRANPDQKDADFDRIGAACDPTEDGDLDDDQVGDANDNCPTDFNPRVVIPGAPGQIELGQPDSDNDGEGDACDPDLDEDGISNDQDVCVSMSDAAQADSDGDRLGDACDPCPNSPDSGLAWGATTVMTLDGEVVVMKPVLPDGDGDGIPDACDPGGFGISINVEIDGKPWDIGLMPRPDDPDRRLTVTGSKGGWIDLPLAICGLLCEVVPPHDVCSAFRFDGFSDDLIATVLDDRGQSAGTARGGTQRDLRFGGQGGRTYRLRLVLGPGFDGRADLDLAHARCTIGDRNPQPYLGPPPIGGPEPTPSPAPSPTPQVFPGEPSATVRVGESEFRLPLGSCVRGTFEGEEIFSLSLVTPLGTPPEDRAYLGLILRDLGDGTYRGADIEIPPNGNFGERHYSTNRETVVVELRNGMSEGEFHGPNNAFFGGGEVHGAFTCPGGPTGPGGEPLP
jgi:hypothetical protein